MLSTPAGLLSAYSQEPPSQSTLTMDTLKIERVGGFGGYGGSHLKSRGEVAVADLSPADHAQIEKLFAGGDKSSAAGTADMFRYRITRKTPQGDQTIEVPGEMVPAALTSKLKDTLE